MYQLIEPFKRMAEWANWAVLILHHNAKHSNKYSGTTGIAGSVDFLWNWIKDSEKLTATMDWEGRGDFQHTLHFAFDLEKQRNLYVGTKEEVGQKKKQEREDGKLYQILKHLELGQEHSKTQPDLEQSAKVKTTTCKRYLALAYNAGYIGRVGVGTCGSAYRYYLTQRGQEIVNKEDGKNLVNSLSS